MAAPRIATNRVGPDGAINDNALAWQAALVAAFIGLIFILSLGFVQYRSAQFENGVWSEYSRSEARMKSVNDYLSLLRDVESGQRGYLVTGKGEFLQSMYRALEDRDKDEGRIALHYPENAQDHDLATSLLKIGNEKIRYSVRTASFYENGQQDVARNRVSSGVGKRLMDSARSLVAQLQVHEDHRSSALQSRAASKRTQMQRTIVLLESLIVFALLAMVFGLHRTVLGLRRRSVQLRDSASRQTAIFENATDAMLMLTCNGTIETMNEAAERLFDFSRDEAAGQSIRVLFAEPPSPATTIAYLARLAAGETTARKQIFTGIRGGAPLDAEVVTTPITLGDGQHFLAVARDATERLQVDRMKNEFVATVSHELRTPLTSIAGSLGLLSGGAAGIIPAKALRLIGIARTNSERLIRLINEMLDIEKIESGKIALDLRPINLSVLIDSAISEIRTFAEHHDVKIAFSRCPRQWIVRADSDRLLQVLTNLMSNAIKFSTAGETVTVMVEAVEDRYRINVSDHGPGIDEEFRSRIFSKFAQADSTTSRDKGGTGLGLSIVQELVGRMNGTVGFDSIPGEGSTFFVELPSVGLGAGATGAEFHSPVRDLNAGARLILHVEDDADMLRLVKSAFEGEAQVVPASSVRRARKEIGRRDFDLVILDIAMPDGNGLDLIPLIRRCEQRVPVILFTALDIFPAEPRDVDLRLTKSKSSLAQLIAAAMQMMANGDRKDEGKGEG